MSSTNPINNRCELKCSRSVSSSCFLQAPAMLLVEVRTSMTDGVFLSCWKQTFHRCQPDRGDARRIYIATTSTYLEGIEYQSSEHAFLKASLTEPHFQFVYIISAIYYIPWWELIFGNQVPFFLQQFCLNLKRVQISVTVF